MYIHINNKLNYSILYLIFIFPSTIDPGELYENHLLYGTQIIINPNLLFKQVYIYINYQDSIMLY